MADEPFIMSHEASGTSLLSGSTTLSIDGGPCNYTTETLSYPMWYLEALDPLLPVWMDMSLPSFKRSCCCLFTCCRGCKRESLIFFRTATSEERPELWYFSADYLMDGGSWRLLLLLESIAFRLISGLLLDSGWASVTVEGGPLFLVSDFFGLT